MVEYLEALVAPFIAIEQLQVRHPSRSRRWRFCSNSRRNGGNPSKLPHSQVNMRRRNRCRRKLSTRASRALDEIEPEYQIHDAD
jgi:hypothetical protein